MAEKTNSLSKDAAEAPSSWLSKNFIPLIAGLGTLLAGVAAFAVFVIPTADSRVQPNPEIPPGPSSAEVAPPASEGIPSVTRLVDVVEDDVTSLLPPGTSPYEEWDAVVSSPFGTRIPSAWTAQEFADWLDDSDQFLGAAVLASTEDIDSLYNTSPAPGVWISGTAATIVPSEILDQRRDKREASCSSSQEYELESAKLVGGATLWTRCGDDQIAILDFAANDPETGATVVVFVKMLSADDVTAAREVLVSLAYDDSVEPSLGDGRRYPGFLRG